MSYVLCLYATLAIIALFKRKYHQHAVHKTLHSADAALLPRPKLRGDKIDYRHTNPVQLLSQPEIEVREVNQHSHFRFPAPRGSNHAEELAINFRDMLNHLNDPNHRNRSGINHD